MRPQTGCEVNFLANPRNEDAENELDVSNKKFMNFLGNMISLESQVFVCVCVCVCVCVHVALTVPI